MYVVREARRHLMRLGASFEIASIDVSLCPSPNACAMVAWRVDSVPPTSCALPDNATDCTVAFRLHTLQDGVETTSAYVNTSFLPWSASQYFYVAAALPRNATSIEYQVSLLVLHEDDATRSKRACPSSCFGAASFFSSTSAALVTSSIAGGNSTAVNATIVRPPDAAPSPNLALIILGAVFGALVLLKTLLFLFVWVQARKASAHTTGDDDDASSDDEASHKKKLKQPRWRKFASTVAKEKKMKVTAKPGTLEHTMQVKVLNDEYYHPETHAVAKSLLDMSRKARIELKAEERKGRAALDVHMTHMQPDEVLQGRHLVLTSEMTEGVLVSVVSKSAALSTRWLFMNISLTRFKLKASVLGKPSKPKFKGSGKRSVELASLRAVTPFTDALPPTYSTDLSRLHAQISKRISAKATATPTVVASPDDEGAPIPERTQTDDASRCSIYVVLVEFDNKPDILYAVESAIDQEQAVYTWQRLSEKAKARANAPARLNSWSLVSAESTKRLSIAAEVRQASGVLDAPEIALVPTETLPDAVASRDAAEP
ncbi:hypothetical protein SDRG_13771 [Saprolegnia diclina VS20]|uniref:Uncharacterized protein n=1 Tax=Saprolegnia diclina (strain VS20) TaxID=1156394 RepID=T0R8P9_SAPDV|nr:hypothetical protein SDRG_13771 [Saprolegnia diclina VS20]EQC28443.1 hypothetical protein SDRG_13771 [Saprolegnia diclina VS20]|eukprot:XP_008618091.1 hypothetical protein SDRG_13771 [Saprolegnia diclina VS20]